MYIPKLSLVHLRVVQVGPVHFEVQVQVFGAEQVPPFRQGLVQTAVE